MNSSLMFFVESMLFGNLHFTVTSARRTAEQNEAAGGVSNSQHLIGEAIDIKPYGSTTYNRLVEFIYAFADTCYTFDQLILYSNFIHISFGSRNRHQVIDKRK